MQLNALSGHVRRFRKNSAWAILLVRLVNESLGQGIFPNCLKTATVKPLYKSDDHQNLNNYRRISVLPVISKVFERVVHNRIYAFLEKFILLPYSQYGYRSKRSTVDAIVSITEKIRDKNTALYSKHHGTLLKMHRIGFRGSVYKWFESYFSDSQHQLCSQTIQILRLH